MWGQSATEDVHICACNTRSMSHTIPFSGSKQHWDTSALHMFVPNYDLSHCDWNWMLWYFSLAISIESMVLDGLLPKGTLEVSALHPLHPPFLDLTFRYGFTILRNSVAQHVQEWWPWERSQGSRCAGRATYFDSYQVVYIKQMVWRHISMQSMANLDMSLFSSWYLVQHVSWKLDAIKRPQNCEQLVM